MVPPRNVLLAMILVMVLQATAATLVVLVAAAQVQWRPQGWQQRLLQQRGRGCPGCANNATPWLGAA